MASKRSKPMLPDLRQSRSYDCGDTALRIVCQHHGWKLPPSMVSHPIDGSDPRTLETVLRQAGIRVTSGEMTLSALQHHTGQGWPTICLVRLDGVGHYIVVESVTDRRIRWQCPSRGPSGSTYRQFLESWGDLDRLGARYHQWGLVPWVDF